MEESKYESNVIITNVSDGIIVQDESDMYAISKNNGEALIKYNEVIIS